MRKLWLFSFLFVLVAACGKQPESSNSLPPAQGSDGDTKIFGVSASEYYSNYLYSLSTATDEAPPTHSYLRSNGFESGPMILESFSTPGKNLYARMTLVLKKDQSFQIFYEEFIGSQVDGKLKVEGQVYVGSERGNWKYSKDTLVVGPYLILSPYSMTDDTRLVVQFKKPLHNEKIRDAQALLALYKGAIAPDAFTNSH